MAKKTKGARRTQPKRAAKKTKTAKPAARARKQAGKRGRREEEPTLPELGDLKDRVLMQHAKSYADSMHDSEAALEDAAESKQAIRSRMTQLNASVFTGHGYEFTITPGESKFTARKVKRGSKPPDTVDEGESRPEPEFDTEPDGSPIDETGDEAGADA